MSHDTVRVIGVEVIAAAGSDGPRAGPGDALALTAGTSDSPWRDQRANDSGLQRLTQIGWDRTSIAEPPISHSSADRVGPNAVDRWQIDASRGSMWLDLGPRNGPRMLFKAFDLFL